MNLRGLTSKCGALDIFYRSKATNVIGRNLYV